MNIIIAVSTIQGVSYVRLAIRTFRVLITTDIVSH